MDNKPAPTPDDQSNPNFTVMPPANPQGSPVGPSGPDNKFKRLASNPVSLIIAVVIFMLLLVGLAFALRGDSTKKKDNSSSTDKAAITFKNWLEPKTEIKVGENRYVSACQILPLKTVLDTMHNGKPPATFAIDEDYYDASPIVERFVIPQTRCSYRDTVTLKAEQRYDPEDIKLLGSYVSTSGSQYIESKVAAYKKAAQSSNDQDLIKYVSQLEASAKTYLEKKDSQSRKDTADLDLSTLIIPTGNGAFSFTLLDGNTIYLLEINSDIRASSIADAPNDQLVQKLKQTRTLTNEIQKNLQNKQLSQSPAPTILSDTPKVGETYILEPCAIVTPQLMQSITGASQPTQIARSSVIYNVTDPVKTKASYAIYPSNDCTKTVSLPTGNTVTKTLIKLDLEYAPNTADLEKKLTDAKFLPLTAGSTELQTSADFAAEYVLGSTTFYQFRVGSYWGYLSMTTINRNTGVQGQLNRDKYVTAINAITESIKTSQKQLESTKGQ